MTQSNQLTWQAICASQQRFAIAPIPDRILTRLTPAKIASDRLQDDSPVLTVYRVSRLILAGLVRRSRLTPVPATHR